MAYDFLTDRRFEGLKLHGDRLEKDLFGLVVNKADQKGNV